MPCYSPLTAYRSKYVNASGKRPLVFNPAHGFRDRQIELPCGRCVGCRLEHSRQWAVRCMHEASLFGNCNSFITLTYSPDNLPNDHSISKIALQKFFKRLRKNTGQKLRYFACGEYGDRSNRPHYHAIIFGYDFPDRVLWSVNNGNLLYRSHMLEKCWSFGHSLIGEVTFQSCAYVARYVMKKRKGADDHVDPKTGKTNAEHYMLADKETGEIHNLEPEFVLMSRRPGIGKGWFDKFKGDLNKDYFTINGVKQKIPKYYDNLLDIEDQCDMISRKNKRIKEAHKRKEDNTFERLLVKEEVKIAQLKYLKRGLEDES